DKTPKLRADLSERVRNGELFGFLEIGPEVFAARSSPAAPPTEEESSPRTSGLRYQSNRPTYNDFPRFVEITINAFVQEQRAKEEHIEYATVRGIMQPVPLESKGLSKLKPDGEVEDASDEGRWGAFLVPFGLLMLMFMVIMMSA